VFEFTYTDTFGGDPNFCWVRRVTAPTLREAKKLLGLTNVRFTKDYGDSQSGRWNESGACRCILSQYIDYPTHFKGDTLPKAGHNV
jgi:hypothetical protein